MAGHAPLAAAGGAPQMAAEPVSLGGPEPVARAACEQWLREVSELHHAGPEASLLGGQHREGPRLGFPELEPGAAGFPNRSRVQV